MAKRRCVVTRRVHAVALATGLWAASGAPAPASRTSPGQEDRAIKVAFYNIRSGKGVPGFRGRAAAFADVANCTDSTKPVNAWGAGIVQRALQDAIGGDDEVIALGLAEAWTSVCASARNVRTALGWAAASSSHNGVAMVARYGLRNESWQQLDTAQNNNPADTAWVLHADVSLDRAQRQTLAVYVAHWYATGAQQSAGYERQARQTVAFMQQTSGGRPHVLIGDLNAWTAASETCRQQPNGAAAVAVLTSAGYVDAWPALHGTADGNTGMLNRAKCGQPEGAAWKRVDYAWSPRGLRPLDMTRFGIVPPGDPAPSDHYGIAVRYPRPR